MPKEAAPKKVKIEVEACGGKKDDGPKKAA
jgi:hypothetical protein